MPKRRVHQNGCRSRSFHIVGYNFDVQLLLGGFSVRYKNHLFKFNRFVFIKIECVCSCSHDNVYIIQLIPIAVERERESEFFFRVDVFWFTVSSHRKKKKMNRSKSNKPCVFCEDATENPVEMGEMLTYKSIRAHNFCLVSQPTFSFVCSFVSCPSVFVYSMQIHCNSSESK